MRRILIGMALLLALGNAGAQTQTELNEDACGQLEKAEAKLNSMLATLRKDYVEDKDFLPKLEKAQKAWAAFRDAQLAALYPVEDESYYGSIHPMCVCFAKLDLTTKRIEQLQPWIEGVEEGDACSGSIKTKSSE